MYNIFIKRVTLSRKIVKILEIGVRYWGKILG